MNLLHKMQCSGFYSIFNTIYWRQSNNTTSNCVLGMEIIWNVCLWIVLFPWSHYKLLNLLQLYLYITFLQTFVYRHRNCYLLFLLYAYVKLFIFIIMFFIVFSITCYNFFFSKSILEIYILSSKMCCLLIKSVPR